ncbi:hypothetical protein ElyMa_004857800 [Elysia marginata]|uniref:Uncharacterized protein n=1 Tax=Elysia marginata TaxID=1093978 RepID=A0AAV4ISX3_9GAST|nr:hypothetical protein ElyMa_004857800 [Elysia marginata]
MGLEPNLLEPDEEPKSVDLEPDEPEPMGLETDEPLELPELEPKDVEPPEPNELHPVFLLDDVLGLEKLLLPLLLLLLLRLPLLLLPDETWGRIRAGRGEDHKSSERKRLV